MIKESLCTSVGIVGSMIISLLGGWDVPMKALIICMIIDYLSGLAVAGIFHKSKKSENGALNSRSGLKGLCMKCMILFIIVVIVQVGKVLNVDWLRNATIIGFISNEFISIVENAGLMGMRLPKPVFKAIDILNDKEKENEKYETIYRNKNNTS